MANDGKLLDDVATYYTRKLAEHGQTPQGVDWNSEIGQTARFAQLCRVLPETGPFSLNDVGCGYGALHDYLSARFDDFTYRGIDVSPAMLDSARARLAKATNVELTTALSHTPRADFSVASGIFNVRMQQSDEAWRSYLESTLANMAEASDRGFAFNCLTSYSDPEYMRDDLFYADPCWLFDLCRRKYSRNVALLHDYDLYEFTILVRL